jgi:hypothetical protein
MTGKLESHITTPVTGNCSSAIGESTHRNTRKLKMADRPMVDWLRYGALLVCASLFFVVGIADAIGQPPEVVPVPEMGATVKGGSFRALQFSPDGRKIWTNHLESWSVATGKLIDPAAPGRPIPAINSALIGSQKLDRQWLESIIQVAGGMARRSGRPNPRTRYAG